jgi:hypothetical protein
MVVGFTTTYAISVYAIKFVSSNPTHGEVAGKHLVFRHFNDKMKNKAKSEPFQNLIRVSVRVMVFNATSNNITVISWRLVSLVDEIGVSGENH